MAAPRTTTAVPRLLAALVLLLLTAVSTALPQAAAGEPGAAPFLQLRIDRVTPDVVTTASDPVVTVSGVVRNVGDRPVRDVVLRLEHAPAVDSSSGLRTNLTGNLDQFDPVADFITVAPELARGKEVPFTLAYPIRGAAGPSLGIDQPGVYPVLVNVNGTPEYGAPARLDDARFLLPVLGVPPEPGAESAADTLTSVVAPDTSKPVRLTMFWPLADKPRLAAGIPGGTTPVRLADDDLAASLAPGGRLETLLAAVDFATGPAVDPGGDVGRALCLAVDPDLLVTVNAMTAGYVVNDGPDAGPTTPTRPGTGQEAAVGWLNRLKALAKRMCVASTPYAQADLDALQRVGDPRLSTVATTGAADIVDQILGVATTRGVTLTGDGPLTGPAAQLLSAQGRTVAVTAATLTARDDATGLGSTAELVPTRYSPNLVAMPFDPTVGAALAGAGSEPTAPTYLDPSLDIPLRQDSPVARRQNAIGSLLWRSLRPDTEPRAQIVVPPLVWSPRPDDAQAVLTTMGTAIRAGLARPRPLREVIAEGDAVPPQPDAGWPADDIGNPRGRIDDAVTSGVAATNGRLSGLTAALGVDERTGLTGIGYTAPLREDMLRALSQSVPPVARNGLAQERLAVTSDTVGDMFGAVRIMNPGGAYTLATERSPLPLALRNDLPVPIRVRLAVDAPPGMTVDDMGEISLPPGYLPLRVPIEVHFTQRVAVDVALQTAAGVPLGEPVRLSVHSNAYGKVLFVITLSAGAVLVLLAGRRLWHRFRGQPDPADLDRPKRAVAEAHLHSDHDTGRPVGDPLDTAIRYAPGDQPVGDQK
ncbi:hypothetical protein AU196_10490 [Mycobacterium sp. IS-1742]|uniref:DUF6049 family protein n=1 Tax=Mycobacterium sp. IS-1742 TaxID=1772285 RepID=UPI0007400552|nr:DUF6049 family protein [Mycobacterium sp. IS-1742]KUI31675.1 hypothetical protein AU196_10490 [Mycobacterium sp. IS-1742]